MDSLLGVLLRSDTTPVDPTTLQTMQECFRGLRKATRKILSPEQAGFRAERSCDIAITHLGFCVEDAHSHKKEIVL